MDYFLSDVRSIFWSEKAYHHLQASDFLSKPSSDATNGLEPATNSLPWLVDQMMLEKTSRRDCGSIKGSFVQTILQFHRNLNVIYMIQGGYKANVLIGHASVLNECMWYRKETFQLLFYTFDGNFTYFVNNHCNQLLPWQPFAFIASHHFVGWKNIETWIIFKIIKKAQI